MKKVFTFPEFYCILAIFICFGLLYYGQVRIENVFLQQDLSQKHPDEKPITLPFAQKMDAGKYFHVTFVVSNPLNIPYDLNIVPDDCAESVTVNGSSISLKNYPGKCNFGKGFLFPHSVISHFQKGSRTDFGILLMNKGGKGGINVLPKVHSFLPFFLKCAIPFFFGLLALFVARRLKFGPFLLFCILAGVILRFAMFYAIPYNKFTQDVDGHLDYIQYIVNNHTLPDAKDCWSCYHPPVYYTTATPAFLLGGLLGYTSTSGVQAFSLALSIVLLLGGFILLKDILSGTPLGIAAILWTVWPSLLLVAPRIGNDQMFYAMHVLSLIAGFGYLKDGKGKKLIAAVLAAALAAWTKSTGYITVGLVFLISVFGYFRTNGLHRPSKTEIVGWILLVFTLSGLAVEKALGGDLVSNATGINHRLKVGTEAWNFLYFDLKTFLTVPYTNPWKNGLGREYFFNYAFKTSLFGEFKLTETQFGRTLATFVSLSFLGLVVFAVRGWWKTKMNIYHWMLLIQGIAFFAALAYLRYKYPYACSNDFRYIMPVLLSFIPYVGLGVYSENASVKWKVLGSITVAVFALCSVMLMAKIFA